MSIVWSYKIDFKNPVLFDKLKMYGINIPDELRTFICNYNGASPDKNHIEINGKERVFDSVLSFNENDVDVATFKAAYQAIDSDEYIPFAIDPFGNHFCYSIKTRKIAFYEHEEEVFDQTNYSLDEFLEHLY